MASMGMVPCRQALYISFFFICTRQNAQMWNEQIQQNTKPVQGALSHSSKSRLPEPLLHCVTMVLVNNVTKRRNRHRTQAPFHAVIDTENLSINTQNLSMPFSKWHFKCHCTLWFGRQTVTQSWTHKQSVLLGNKAIIGWSQCFVN